MPQLSRKSCCIVSSGRMRNEGGSGACLRIIVSDRQHEQRRKCLWANVSTLRQIVHVMTALSVVTRTMSLSAFLMLVAMGFLSVTSRAGLYGFPTLCTSLFFRLRYRSLILQVGTLA